MVIDSFTQIISDEAKALLKLAKEENAQHNTDLLHVLLEISKALSVRLASQKYQTQKLLDEAESNLDKKKKNIYSSPYQHEARIKIAEKILAVLAYIFTGYYTLKVARNRVFQILGYLGAMGWVMLAIRLAMTKENIFF